MIRLVRVVQVLRWSGDQVVRMVRVVSLDDMLSENTNTRTVESRAVFCLSRIRNYQISYIVICVTI